MLKLGETTKPLGKFYSVSVDAVTFNKCLYEGGDSGLRGAKLFNSVDIKWCSFLVEIYFQS